MPKTSYTPGPWELSGRLIINDQGYSVGEVWDNNNDPQNIANAHLIAAAPELDASHEALIRIIEDTMPELCGCAEIQNAYAIRRKARGE